jgi:predicted dehydrogenase
MMETVRIGIIGSGFVGRTHAHAIARGAHHATLCGIAGGSRAGGLATEFHAMHYNSPEALAASHDVDAVIIATPPPFHREHALLCAGHGKHVLLEKPMAPSVNECHDIIEACQTRKLTLMVAFTQRFRTSNIRARDIIQSGMIGKPLMIEELALLPNGLRAYPAWQQRPENLGILFGYGIHNIDKLRWILNAEAETVSAQILRTREGVETSTMATIRWSNGVLSNLWSSVDLPAPGFEATAFRSRIVGEKGLLDVDGYGAVRLARAGEEWETVFVQPPIDWRGAGMFSEARMGAFIAQDQAFVDSVRTGTPPPVTGLDGRQAVAVVLAAYESAAQGNTITLRST